MLQFLKIPSFEELTEEFRLWLKEDAMWWLASTVGHALLLVIVLLVVGTAAVVQEGEAPVFEAKVDNVIPEPELDHFDPGDTPIEPTELNTETLTLTEAPQMAQDEQINGDPSEAFEEAGGGTATAVNNLGGLGGFDVKGVGAGPMIKGAGGVGEGKGTGNNPGSGGAGSGFGGRGAGVRRAMLGSYGGTKGSERAVAAALNWLARHQMPDGRWSLGEFRTRCKDASCTAPGSANSDTAATAMGLLPYFAAGQTHKSKGPYQKNIYAGLYWLMKQQKSDGDLRGGAAMYSHGLASIALCEAYGLTYDRQVGAAAQEAVNYICAAQNASGGWHYSPGAVTHDTSVVGWQIMSLKSAQMAGLNVPPQSLAKSQEYLKLASSGQYGGLFAYVPGGGGTDTMTSVGLLCTQYLGAKRNDPRIQEGMSYLMARLPNENARNCYYWYYATQVMHNLPGYEWDEWNRKMRRILIESQSKQGCAAGSWDPLLPTKDTWSDTGGRIMMTSLCCLTLEVYYRYLPLYKLDAEDPAAVKDLGGKDAGKPAGK